MNMHSKVLYFMIVMTHDPEVPSNYAMIKGKLMIWEEQTNRDCNVHTICMNAMNGTPF